MSRIISHSWTTQMVSIISLPKFSVICRGWCWFLPGYDSWGFLPKLSPAKECPAKGQGHSLHRLQFTVSLRQSCCSNLKQDWFWESLLCIHELWVYSPRTLTKILFNTKWMSVYFSSTVLWGPSMFILPIHLLQSAAGPHENRHAGSQDPNNGPAPLEQLLLCRSKHWPLFPMLGPISVLPPDRCPLMSFQVQAFSLVSLVGGLQTLIKHPSHI